MVSAMPSESLGSEDWEWVDGAAYSRRFGDVYHSRAGALAQAEAVFLRGAGLPQRWRRRRSFAILENGFGFGVNALVTLAAWLADGERSSQLDYVGIDAYPRSAEAIARFWAQLAPASLQPLVSALLAGYPPPTPGFHRLFFAEGRVRLTLVWLPAEEAARQLGGTFDALYLDGFSPAKNPQMWAEPLIAALVARLAPGAQVATWSAAGSVRRALAAAGLTVVRQPGFGGKRERLEAYRSSKGPAISDPPQTVAVVGAGLAGAAAAQALAERGVTVTLFEALPQPATGASGNPVGAARWLPSRDDNRLAQWTRTGLLLLKRRWPEWAARGAVASWCGALQVARSTTDAQRMAETLARLPWLAPHLTYCDAAAAAEAVGAAVARGGWWFPDGGWVRPATLVQAWLTAAHEVYYGAAVTAVQQTEEGWLLLWRDAGQRVHEQRFAAVVLAVGAGTTPHWPHTLLPLGAEPQRPGVPVPVRPVRGQVSWVAGSCGAALRAVVTGNGYVVPPAATGSLLFGAASAADDWASEPREEDHRANCARLAAMLPEVARCLPDNWSGRVSWRAATHDHLPVVGALPLGGRWDDPKRWQSRLWVLNGLGARGIALALLAAELLAALLCRQPLPVGRPMAAAVDPARFARRADLLYSTTFDD